MSKRLFPRVAIALIASVLFTAVAHACSDLSTMQAILQAPCDHRASWDEPRGKTEKHECDSVRYAIVSTQALPSQTELLKLYSMPIYEALLAGISLRDILPLFWRSQGPPHGGLGVSSLLSHVVLRI